MPIQMENSVSEKMVERAQLKVVHCFFAEQKSRV